MVKKAWPAALRPDIFQRVTIALAISVAFLMSLLRPVSFDFPPNPASNFLLFGHFYLLLQDFCLSSQHQAGNMVRNLYSFVSSNAQSQFVAGSALI
jgi:hypothetical protein